MNYIGLLTKEEKSILCEIITGKEFKELFNICEQAFSSNILRGLRAKKLTEQRALSLAKSNIDNSPITNLVNQKVEHWLKKIQENIDKLERDGLSRSDALATTMIDSVFVNNIELYFKLIDQPLEADEYSNLYKRMDNIKSERARENRINDLEQEINDLKKENRKLSDQIDEAKRSKEAILTEYEESKNKLKSSLDEALAKIKELQTVPSNFSNDDADYLAQFDDTNILPSRSADETISLCGVTSDRNGKKCLKRYADLDNNRRYYIFHQNKDIKPYFENRDLIFYDGPSNYDSYGIWIWSAVPNKNDPSKDFTSWNNTDIAAIEIVTIEEATTLDDLVEFLKKGIKYRPHSQKVMFSLCASKGKHTGILLRADKDFNFNSVNEKITISPSCNVVPIYEFNVYDIIHLGNELSFYQNAFAGRPNKLYHLKSQLDIVKDTVLSSISWAACKERKIARAEFRAFKNFIEAIPVDNITHNIGNACRCSLPAASKLLDEFKKRVWKYVDGDSLEDEIILSVISANTELQEQAKELIRKDWETENERLLIDARVKLNSLNEDLNKAQEELKKTKAEDERLANSIAEKKRLAAEVEKEVAVRIQKARENAADFIASMAFVSGQQMQVECTESPTKIEVSSKSDTDTYRICPEYENLDDLELETHHSWQDVINTAIDGLAAAGVVGKYTSGLAAFLCAAYINKQPLLLVGPNAIDIIQAFSAAVTAHKHGVLCCEGSYAYEEVKKIGTAGERIVIINNFLASGWVNRLPEILYKKDIFYVFTHPYAEDIQVEPKSLYGFMLPLFTEFLVDKEATGEYYGGYLSEEFKPYLPEKDASNKLSGLSKFALSSLVSNKINRLAATMHGIYPDATADDDFLFCVFPIAYASMAIKELAEEIADSQKGISVSARLKHDLKYVLGEI